MCIIGYWLCTSNWEYKKTKKRLMEKLKEANLGEFVSRFGWIWSVVLWLWPMARSHHSGYTSTVEPLATKVAVWKGRDARRKRVITTMFFKTSSNFNVILQNLKFWITLVILDSLKTNYKFSLLVLHQQNEEQNNDLKKNT